MIDPVSYNVFMFVLFTLSSFVLGFIWGFNKKVCMTIIIIGIVSFIFLIITLLIDTASSSDSFFNYPWYYYIGAVLAGFFNKNSFRWGKETYQNVFGKCDTG